MGLQPSPEPLHDLLGRRALVVFNIFPERGHVAFASQEALPFMGIEEVKEALREHGAEALTKYFSLFRIAFIHTPH